MIEEIKTGVEAAQLLSTLNAGNPAISAGDQVSVLLGLLAGGITTISCMMYFAWRRFRQDNRVDATGVMQQELFAQLQAAADQHLKGVKELQGLLDAERSYSYALNQRYSEQLKAWVEERRIWEEERRALMQELTEATSRIEHLNQEIAHMSVQLRRCSEEISRLNWQAHMERNNDSATH